MNIYSRSNPPQGFYVYAYIRSKDSSTAKAGTPYYIGKGKGIRASQTHSINRPKDKNFIVIIEQNLSEIGAFALERRIIKRWGRIDINTGILRNKTDGGEGSSGHKFSIERNKKISEMTKGKIVSTETRLKLSIANKNSNIGAKNGMYGRKHTDTLKLEHSNRMKGNQHNVGKIWIHNPVLLKTTSIKKEEPIPDGWVLGMLPRKIKNRTVDS